MTSKLYIAIAVLIVVVLISVTPLISLWALNTLFVGVVFAHPIDLTIYTYLAMLWINGMIGIVLRAKITSN